MGATEPARSAPIEILRLAGGGDGVGRLPDGLTVFVPRSAPGDLVTLRDIRRKRGFARARVADIIAPGPGRVEPPCPHYTRDQCGGCQLQHLSGPAQLQARRRIVGDALRRIGKLDIEDPPIEAAPESWGYRTRLSLHAVGGRIGLRPLDRPADAFELDRCLIAHPALQELWLLLKRHRTLLPQRLVRLTLRLGTDGTRHVIATLPPRATWQQARALASALSVEGVTVTLWTAAESAPARPVAGAVSSASAMSFEQVNPEMGARIRTDAVSLLAPIPGEEVWDLYAGLGETTAQLVELGARVSSVELDRQAVAWAEQHGPPARRVAGAVERSLAALPRPARVITNPPRTGMHEDAASELNRSGAERIVYISCDPATLARDLARLTSFRLRRCRAYDLFPQTAHVETIAVMERA
ncbi:MAG TPA: TRAM domain-containing protein [Gemmatimonadales bacterium]|nr:TRAM domain-containing protein [Gemmatimonadales bacterium]